MSIFKLPDLGEGLPDAEIQEWRIKAGDTVKVDQVLVSMETAKAVVDVPSPQDGVIKKLYGQPGDIIITGAALIEFESDEQNDRQDEGTVVGNIKSQNIIEQDTAIIGAANASGTNQRVKATPKVRAMARKHNIDLASITGTGDYGVVTQQDIEARLTPQQSVPEGFEAIRGVRRSMVVSMTKAHAEIVPVTIFDDANISNWEKGQDITVRIIKAMCKACIDEPALNAWYHKDTMSRKLFDTVHLGLAVDTPDGLFVPVINSAEKLSSAELREAINTTKQAVMNRELPPEQLTGHTITLSNFGKFAGRYASPIIVPPTVCILGVGRLYESAGQRLMPLSLTFDHRAATGGEATRALGMMIESLQLAVL